MAEDLALYLRLAPEFGGTRFGPFEGAEVRLGSDQSNNEIVLPEALGVAPAHVRIYRQADMGIIVAPVDRTAAVYVWQGNATKPKQINTPVATRAGDSFALVTAQGPRFFIEIDKLPEEVVKKREQEKKFNPARRRLSAEAFKQEGKRQALTSVLSTGIGQMAQRAYVFVVSGAIFQPRNIIMLFGVAGGYIFGGVQSCRMAGVKSELDSTKAELDNKGKEVSVLKDISNTNSADLKFSQLVLQVTGATALASALDEDQAMAAAVKEKAALIAQSSKDYEWLINPKKGAARAGNFARIREAALEESEFDPDTAKLIPWLAAVTDLSQEGWTSINDSNAEQVCGRGPMAITYRQAINFGLTPVLDAYLKGSLADYDGEGSRALRAEALKATAKAAGIASPTELEGEFETQINLMRTGREACLALAGGDDKRDNVGVLLRTLARHLGASADFVPAAGKAHAVTARIAKFFAADIDTVVFSEKRSSGLDLNRGPVGAALGQMGPQGAWVKDHAAETIARSTVLPCQAVLKYGENPAVAATFGDALPSPVYCLILDWKLRNE